MIRYPITKKQLEAAITAEDATWLQRAADRTEEFRKKGFYEEKSSIWSEVKPVYMRLQGLGKCAYCEREMERVQIGKVDHDVEHFRPKGNVKGWKAPKNLTDDGITFTAAPTGGKGYHLLPYHPFNYAAACKPCNSTLKKDHFPIAGTYDLDGDDPAGLTAEKPYLLYPIGDLDDADERKHLYRDRAILIMALFPLLEKTRKGSAAAKTAAQATVDGFLIPQLRHLNCARNFKKLHKTDSTEAEAIYNAAVKLMTTIS